MRDKIISTTSEWTFELIQKYNEEIARVAANFKLDTYPTQIEIISAEQMMDAYASVGMPLGYSHWSYGKQFLQTQQQYKRGQMGLALQRAQLHTVEPQFRRLADYRGQIPLRTDP